MFDTETLTRLKDLVKAQNTTQASLVSELVRFGLDNADVNEFDLVTAKKRGRKPNPVVLDEEPTTPDAAATEVESTTEEVSA